ncbi:MAG: hypothetical protein HKO59_01930 [Phycisphaerales bacterium]|nr:hypothetical protein [Phycisphaerae bacterium]NNF43971.1 hypothetical protein [Phycisphaerales bacterium]NNM24741.1 hypothetical protein [Phycisphaerales bacterium]
MADKLHIIDGILALNPTAGKDWLERFDLPALRRYHHHLEHALEPRGSFWFRDAETPAVVTRAPAA